MTNNSINFMRYEMTKKDVTHKRPVGRPKSGRPKIDSRIIFRVDPQTRLRIYKLAAHNGQSVSAYIRDHIEEIARSIDDK